MGSQCTGAIRDSYPEQEDLGPVSSQVHVLPGQVFINTRSLLQVGRVPVICHRRRMLLHQVLQDGNAATQRVEKDKFTFWQQKTRQWFTTWVFECLTQFESVVFLDTAFPLEESFKWFVHVRKSNPVPGCTFLSERSFHPSGQEPSSSCWLCQSPRCTADLRPTHKPGRRSGEVWKHTAHNWEDCLCSSSCPCYLLWIVLCSRVFFSQHVSFIFDHLRDAVMFCLEALTSDPQRPTTGCLCSLLSRTLRNSASQPPGLRLNVKPTDSCSEQVHSRQDVQLPASANCPHTH